MTTLREAAQQALEALEEYQSKGAPFLACDGAVDALRAALAQQAEPVPVAWSGYDLDGMVEAFSRVIEAHHSSKHPFHNPIDMDARMALRVLRGFIPAMKAYTAPSQRKPLTEKEMYIVEEEARKNFRLAQAGPRGQMITYWDSLTPWLIRAVERAHGIKEN